MVVSAAAAADTHPIFFVLIFFFSSIASLFLSFLGCTAPTNAIDRDEQLLRDVYDYLLQFEQDVIAVNDRLVEACGTANPSFLVDVAGALLGYTCAAVGVVWRVREAFQCSTWLPIYYNTVYNAMCYNGVDGVWTIAATQFLTCLMACVICTCRCVFFDLTVEGESDGDEEKEDDEGRSEEERDDDDGKDRGEAVQPEQPVEADAYIIDDGDDDGHSKP